MINQQEEHRQMKIEQQIQKYLDELYKLLQQSDREHAEGTLGFVAQAIAEWENGKGGEEQ